MLKDAPSAAALLAWYRDMGVDAPVAEVPVDWLSRGDQPPGSAFALPSPQPNQPAAGEPQPPAAPLRRPSASAAPSPPGNAPAPVGGRPFPAATPDAAVMTARAMARKAETLAAIEAQLATFDGCALKATAKNLCFYRGAAQARVMCIGEAPGRDEDLQGKPFVGRAGQLLDKMLAAIGLSEETVHITNIVYWRPPGNRTPTPQETATCRPFVERQIELVDPDFLVCLGNAAAQELMGTSEGILRLRGHWREFHTGTRTIRVMAALHPAYLLRQPLQKRLAWRDFLMLKAALDASP